MPKKIPMRTCIGCGAVKPKKELIRIVLTQEGFLRFLDLWGGEVEWLDLFENNLSFYSLYSL